jgi:hypothetical protein
MGRVPLALQVDLHNLCPYSTAVEAIIRARQDPGGNKSLNSAIYAGRGQQNGLVTKFLKQRDDHASPARANDSGTGVFLGNRQAEIAFANYAKNHRRHDNLIFTSRSGTRYCPANNLLIRVHPYMPTALFQPLLPIRLESFP